MEPTPLTPAAARDLILGLVTPVAPRRAGIGDAAGLVVAEPLVAALDLPPFTNAAMDGYAVRTADLGPAGARLRVTGRVAAGCEAGGTVGAGEAVAVATGAIVPG
ncbi:MAG: molybdopterin molybdenumtransferase MoeA, partial [Actinomycetota bacterium]